MKPSFDLSETIPDVPRPVFSIVKDQDSKFVDGHNRLRIDCDALAERLTLLQRTADSHDEALKNVAKRTTDVGQLRFTPQVVVAIVAVCASIITGQYLSTAGIKEEQAKTNTAVASVNSKMDALRQHDVDSTMRLEERAAALSDAIKRVETRGEMTDMKVNNLRETVLLKR